MNMKEEAVKRMESLGLMRNVIGDFKRSGKVYYSERTPLGGILYWLDNKPEWVQIVKDLEEQYGFLCYHATHEVTEFGELLDLLIVTKYEEDWETERLDIQDGYVFSYVVNLSEPAFSEYGTIAVKQRAGGLVRVR